MGTAGTVRGASLDVVTVVTDAVVVVVIVAAVVDTVSRLDSHRALNFGLLRDGELVLAVTETEGLSRVLPENTQVPPVTFVMCGIVVITAAEVVLVVAEHVKEQQLVGTVVNVLVPVLVFAITAGTVTSPARFSKLFASIVVAIEDGEAATSIVGPFAETWTGYTVIPAAFKLGRS